MHEPYKHVIIPTKLCVSETVIIALSFLFLCITKYTPTIRFEGQMTRRCSLVWAPKSSHSWSAASFCWVHARKGVLERISGDT